MKGYKGNTPAGDIPQNSYSARFKWGGGEEGYNLNNGMRGREVLMLLAALLAVWPAVQARANLATCRTFAEGAAEGAACAECKNNYHLHEGVCYVDILGCAEYVSGNICRKCANGYILVNNECCDRACLNKVYLKLQNSIDHQQNREEARRKAELEGYEKAVSVLAKNSIKPGQNYEILSSRSQYFGSIYRYQVRIDIQGKQYLGLLDYDVETKQAALVDLSLEGGPARPELSLNEENIHTNEIYEKGYKYIYMKYGLELYELAFSRMTALQYDRTTELKFVFVGGQKAVIIAVVVGGDQEYTLWKEEKENGEEVQQHVDNLRQVETLSREPSFQAVLGDVLASKAFDRQDVEVVNITAVSREEYLFVIYVKSVRIRYVVRGAFSAKTQTVTIKRLEEVFHPKLQQMQQPEKPASKVLDKQAAAASSEAKEAFDYLYKVRPSFRQTAVEAVKIETASEIKTLTIMQTREGREYRTVILKDQKTGELQLVDESAVATHPPATTVIEHRPDGTTSVTTNRVDPASPQARAVLAALKHSSIDTSTTTISTLQSVEGERAVEFTVVLTEAGRPAKQVSVVQGKEGGEAVVTDVRTLEEERYVAPVGEPATVIPAAQFYRPEMKELVTLIQHNAETAVSIARIKSITVANSSLASRYELVVENAKGEEVAISAIQDRADQSVQVISVRAAEQTLQVAERTQTTTSRTVSSYGVTTEFSNDRAALATEQSVNVAVAAITAQLPELAGYEVVSSLTKTYTQSQVQTLILSNGSASVQVSGSIDIKTLRYVPLEHRVVPAALAYPLLQQSTVPALLYPAFAREHREVKDCEALLAEKFRMFKGKLPASATVEQFGQVVKTTFHYEIGSKKFVAVVDFNSSSKAGRVVEMSPVAENVAAVTVETRAAGGVTTTSSSSVQEIRSVNAHTDAVLAAITAQYPLLKRYNVTQVAVSEGAHSAEFTVTFTDRTSNLATLITSRADKQGAVTVENIETREAVVEQAQAARVERVVVAREEYSSSSVQQLVQFVEQQTASVSNVTSITAELSPSFTTYRLQVLSNGKTVDVTVIDRNGVKEVVAVRTSSPQQAVAQLTTVRVDQNGNQITETNNATTIKESKSVQASVKTIITEAAYLHGYDVQFVKTTDYGTLQEIAVTFDSPETTKPAVQSVVFFNKTDSTVKVVSVEQVKTTTTEQTTIEVAVAPKPYVQTKFIPGFVVKTVAETDKTLKAVITSIQSTSTVLSTATTVSVEVQTISEETVKYTVILEANGEKSQAIYIANPVTVKITPITITPVPTDSVAYFFSTTQSPSGSTTITSNSVEQIAATHPEVRDVLSFASSSFIISEEKAVSSVSVSSSAESTTYSVEVTEQQQRKTVVLNWDSASKEVKLVDFNVAPVGVVYPRKDPEVTIDLVASQTAVEQYTAAIEASSFAGVENVQQVLAVSKEITYKSEKLHVEVVNMESVKYFVTLEKTGAGEYAVVEAVAEVQAVVQDAGELTVTTDANGNSVTETTQSGEINGDAPAQTTIKEVVKSEKTLHDYRVVNMRKIDYGAVQQIHLVFQSQRDHQAPVQTIAFYNKTDATVKVVSAEEVRTTVSAEATISVTAVPKPYVETKFIPGFAVQTVLESDKTLKAVITSIQGSSTVLSTASTVSVEVQTISEETVKYTVVLEVGGERSQAIYIANPVTVQLTPITIVQLPSEIKPVYVKQETGEDGSKVVRTNNVTYIAEAHSDFKEVSAFLTATTGATISSSATHIEVTSQNTLNTYRIVTTLNSTTTTVVVTSDTTTKKQFLLNYEETVAVPAVEGAPYTEVLATADEKKSYLEWVKTLEDSQLATAINVVSVQTIKNALSTEVVLEVETTSSQNVFIKTIKTSQDEQPQVLSITPAPLPLHTQETTTTIESSSVGEIISAETTVHSSDPVGNTVIESTHPVFISGSAVIQSVQSSIAASYAEYSSYSVKYTRTVEFGKSTQVLVTLEGPSPADLPIQAVAFYNQTSKTTRIVHVKEIREEAITAAPYPVPQVPTTTVPAALVPEAIKKDGALKTVITQITKSAAQWESATVSSVEVQSFDAATVQYSVVMEVKGEKHQFVQLFNRTSSVATPLGVTQLPAGIKTVLHTQTKIDSQEVVISNSIETVRLEYPQTAPTIEAFIQENPTIAGGRIDSIVVAPSSEGSSVSIVAKNERETSFVFTKYVTSESAATVKVESHTVPAISMVRPKPIVAVPISSEELLGNGEVAAQLIKLVNTDASSTTLQTSRITSVVRSEKTSVDIYTVYAVDANDLPISIQLVQNPLTRVVKVVDVAKVDEEQRTMTETTVQEFTGKSEVLTTNVATIKESKEFKKIAEYISKNHQAEAALTAAPLIELTEKYQRASIKTISFSREGRTVQGTYLLDQRSNTTVELSYSLAPAAPAHPAALPLPTPTLTLTSPESIRAESSSNLAITTTLAVIQKVDFSLANVAPSFVEIKNYSAAAMITLVFDTPTSNSRILSFYDSSSKEAKVIDYTKVPKLIEPSRTLETVNELGQATLFTTSTKAVTSSQEFTQVYATAVRAVPALAEKPIKGVSITTHQSGKEFTILVVESGVISQVVLRSETATKEVSFLSHSASSLAAELIATLPRPLPTKLSGEGLQQPAVQEIATLIAKDSSLGLERSTVLSGSVTRTEFVETYELVVRTSSESSKTVTVVKDLKTNDLIVNNVQPVPRRPSVEVRTTTRQNAYGQVEVVTNNYTEIVTTEEISTIIKTIRIRKPSFASARPVSAKTVTYGTIIESTLVFSDSSELTLRPLQITSILNTKTGVVEIVDSRSFSLQEGSTAAVSNPFQTIPAPAIKIAAKKSTEITKIISSVQQTTTSSTQIETLTVEDFGSVKKYVAIAPTEKGKLEVVYFFDKTTSELKTVSSREVTAVQNPVVYSETVNQHGQTVISSTSVEKITTTVQEVSKAVELLTSTFSSSITESITSVQATGSVVKEIQFVTVDSRQQQSVITVLADSRTDTVKIVDVRQPAPPRPTERGEDEERGEAGGERGVRVSPTERKAIQAALEASSEVAAFEKFTVSSVTSSQSAFTTTYTATILDSSGLSANVSLIMNAGEKVQVVQVQSSAPEQVVVQGEVVSQTSTSAVTGEVRVVTNDRKTIQKDHSVKEITSSIIRSRPELTAYQPVATQTVAYRDVQQTTVVLHSQGELSVQATVLYNTTSSAVQVLHVQKLQEESSEVVANRVQTIPAPAIKIAARKNIEITQIIASVQEATTSTTQIETLTVEELGSVRKYVAIAAVESGRQQVVFLYDKAAQKLKQVSSQALPASLTVLNVEQTTSKWGETVLTSNSIDYVTQKYPETPAAVQAVATYFNQEVASTAQSVQVVEQSGTVTYKLVVEVGSSTQQVVVVKLDGKYVVDNVQSVQAEAEAETAEPQEPQKVEEGSEVAAEITKIIESSSNTLLASGSILSITATESLISTVYTAEVRDSTGKVSVLEFLSEPGEGPVLTSTTIKQQTVTETVQESVTTKTVNSVTSQTVTTTTDSSVILSAENQLFLAEVAKLLPQVQQGSPVLLQTTVYGSFEEKTIIVESESSTVQVTTIRNTKTNELTVLDHKTLPFEEGETLTRPATFVSVIPAPLVTATSQQIVEIATIITQVKAATKQEVSFESVTIEDFGSVKKFIAVQSTAGGKQQYVYLQEKASNELTLLQNYTVTGKVQALVYEQTTNQFGEVSVASSSVSEATIAVPDLAAALAFISTKYPAATPERVIFLSAVEYPSFYQSSVTVQSEAEVKVTIVVRIDKATKEVTEMGAYSPVDIPLKVETTETSSPTSPAGAAPVALPASSPVLADVVRFIEGAKEVPVSEVKRISWATASQTVFGSEVIRVEAVGADSSRVEVEVSYDPASKEVQLHDYQLVEAAQSQQEAVTEFRVDVLTGTKTTTTNDSTVIASSEITTALVKELQQGRSELTAADIVSSTTVEYPDKVKLVTLFQAPAQTDFTQVTSIYDKLTLSVRVIDTTTTTTTSSSTESRQVFTSSEVQTAQTTIPSVPATTAFLAEELPIYAGQAPALVIVEAVGSSDLVSYIFESGSVKTQVVVMHNRTSGESTLLESNPIQTNVQAFFYEEKRNAQGQTVVTSNNLTEVVQRLPQTELLQTYLQSETHIDTAAIRTVESTAGTTFNTYTLVVETAGGLQQYGFLVNTESEEVRTIENKTLPGINNVFLPQPRPRVEISPQGEEALPLLNSLIAGGSSSLTSLASVVSVSKSELSNVQSYHVEYVDSSNQLTKLVVTEGADHKPVVVDQLPVPANFVPQPPVVIAETVDPVTKTSEVSYSSSESFRVDAHAAQVLEYASQNIAEVQNYTLSAVRKSVFGQIEQYDLLYKSAERAPLQVSIANDNNNKNMLLLETRRITEPESRSVLDSSAALPQTVEVSDIEKENIKVLSKLGLVKDVKEYKEVALGSMGQNEQFVAATEAVKQSYSVLLKESVIIKVLEKKSLESDSVKVFFKAKDQIFEASIEINPITGETRLTDFIKIGTQATTRSEVNVYADLCYGYQVVEDLSADSNIDFLLTYLRAKYEQLREASLTEAQSIVLGSGRINYKLYFKKDGQTVKYIVYYEPEYKRVLEVKGTSFLIGGSFAALPADQQVADPYFRKLDTYIRQNRGQLTSAAVLHTESADDGRTLTFRTVYAAAGKTYRSIAAISKDSQNVEESALNEIVEIPTDDSPADVGENDEALAVTKLDIHDLGKNLYFTEAHRFIQDKYPGELDKAQLLGASGKSSLFSYLFREFYMVDDKILTVSAEYNPVTQTASIAGEPQVVDVQEGYFPVRSDRRLTEVRNWLKEKNLDLSAAVMVSSMSKPILFGSAYKLLFKDMTRFYTYVVYYDATTREMRILFEKDSSQPEAPAEAPAETASSSAMQPKLKGFARPSSSNELAQ